MEDASIDSTPTDSSTITPAVAAALRRIEDARDRTDGLGDKAALAVEEDLSALRELEGSVQSPRDRLERSEALSAIGSNAAERPEYRAELERQAPVVAEEARLALSSAEHDMSAKEDRKIVDMVEMDLDAVRSRNKAMLAIATFAGAGVH